MAKLIQTTKGKRTFEQIKADVDTAMDMYVDQPDGAFWAMVAEYAGLDATEGLASVIDYLETD